MNGISYCDVISCAVMEPNPLKTFNHWAATAPSTTRWSLLSVTLICFTACEMIHRYVCWVYVSLCGHGEGSVPTEVECP